jgi:hypothetical protein
MLSGIDHARPLLYCTSPLIPVPKANPSRPDWKTESVLLSHTDLRIAVFPIFPTFGPPKTLSCLNYSDFQVPGDLT